MQTDPIADFLTRIRNAAAAKHQRVDVPASKLKTEIARILKEEGYISTFKMVDENKTRKMLRVFLKYTPDRRSVIYRHEAHFASRLAPLSRRNRYPPGRWRAGHQHFDDAERLDERTFRPQSQSGRRNSLRSLVIGFGRRGMPFPSSTRLGFRR